MKLWLLMPFILGLIGCDALVPPAGADDGSGRCNSVSKKHPDNMTFVISLNCPFEKSCETKIFFNFNYYYDSLSTTCHRVHELRYVAGSESKKIRSNVTFPVMMSPDEHIQFSLIDEDNVEKKYDVDLSRIIHSFTVRGDSVEVTKFDGMESLHIYKYRGKRKSGAHDIIDLYPDSLKSGKYVFYQDSLYMDEISFNCGLGSQGSFATDSVFVYGTLYWR